MKKLFLLLTLIGIGFGIYHFSTTKLEAQDAGVAVIDSAVIEEPKVDIETEEYTIQDGDTFTVAMEALGIDYSDALKIVEKAEPVIDFTNVKLGKTFKLVTEDGLETRIEYEPNPEQLFIVDLTNGFETIETEVEYDLSLETAELTINNSMYADGLEAGLPELLILKFADIFAWEIDFSVQVQPGDTFKVLYEKRSRNGVDSGVGDVIKGEFVNSGESYYAYKYEGPDGETSYYSEEGGSLVKEFLKAPLSFSRITSGYTNSRFHPTLKKNLPHKAIDYAAPAGTHVMAVADGVVTFAGWSGCFGNFVDIRHNGTFETQYAHNSKLLVKVGDRVKQGDTIALVGTTGCSTGNHVHYQVRVNGELQNPLEVEFPAGDSITEDQLDEFNRQKAAIDAKW